MNMLIYSKTQLSFREYGWATENLFQTKSVLQAKEYLSSMNPSFLSLYNLSFPALLLHPVLTESFYGDIPIVDPPDSHGDSCSVTAGIVLSFSIPSC